LKHLIFSVAREVPSKEVILKRSNKGFLASLVSMESSKE